MGYMPEDYVEVPEAPRAQSASLEAGEAIRPQVIYEELDKLIDMVAHENALLEKHDIKAVGELHSDKLRLIRRIELRKELMQRHPEIMMTWTLDEKQQIAALQHELEVHLMENMKRAYMAHRVNHKVVEAVTQALKDHDGQTTGYGSSGEASGDTTGRAKETPSHALAFNESI